MTRPILALVLATTMLAGCSMEPKYVRPEAPVPASWPVGDAYLRQSEAALPAITYRDVFKDVRLQRLIDQALANNRDLRVAAANIAAARAQYGIQRANLFPAINATGRYSYSGGGNGARTNATGGGSGTGGTGTRTGTGGTGTGGTGTGTGGTGTGTGGTGIDPGTGGNGVGTGGIVTGGGGSAFSAQVGTNAFEIDLFGRLRSLSRAALDRYFATEAGARATRLTLVGEVATAWLDYAADRSLLTVAEDTARSAAVSVRLTRARLEGGISARTDLRQAEQILETANADLAEQKTLVAQDVNALQLLVGAPIDPALLPDSIDTAAPTIVALPAGLDSGILLRRPDVVQAEYTLRSYNAQIGAARAALFPRISLTGLVGFASNALSSLFTGGAFTYSVAPSVSYPIFQAGAGRANVRYTEAQRDAALATYEKTIQTAFQEVANALARQGTIADQLRAQTNFREAAADTLRLVNARYQGGLDTFLSSLDAQRSYYASQRTLIQTQLTAATNRATLYRVLGGDSSLDAAPEGPRPVSPSGLPRPS